MTVAHSLALFLLVVGTTAVCAQSEQASPDSSVVTEFDAAEADGDLPRSKFIKFNHFEGKHFSIRVGGGFLLDYSTYIQDDNSSEQMALEPKSDLRDFRVIAKGGLFFPERLSYTFGYMYDKAQEEWRVRQTGFMVNIKELYGQIFVGRTKEGFSTSKIMVGYQGWTMERAAISDALLPILADGVKWSGFTPDGKFLYNLGYFWDTRTQHESFNKNDKQWVVRGVWLPFMGTDKGILHLALQFRYGESNDGFLRYRARPEAFQAQEYAIDTDEFAADHSETYGAELYYRPGPTMVGMEYFFNLVSASESGDPLFHGGEIIFSHILTGETKPYNTRGGYFERVSPARPVFGGGLGAWELVLRFSYADLTDGPIQGGKFWRVTPMANWHMTDNVRLEFVYGYGVLDRFDLKGATHFFQSRLQTQL